MSCKNQNVTLMLRYGTIIILYVNISGSNKLFLLGWLPGIRIVTNKIIVKFFFEIFSESKGLAAIIT